MSLYRRLVMTLALIQGPTPSWFFSVLTTGLSLVEWFGVVVRRRAEENYHVK